MRLERAWRAALAAFLLGGAACQAAPVELIRDVNRTVSLGSFDGKTLSFGANSVLALCGSDSLSNCGAWITDGTPEGTHELPGTRGAAYDVRSFRQAGAVGYFIAKDGASPDRVWRTDGTPAGTAPVPFGPAADYAIDPVGLGMSLVYASATQRQLWITDGSSGGTFMLSPDVVITSLSVAGGQVLFMRGVPGAYELWKSDGSVAGTVLVKALPLAYFLSAKVIDNRILFAADSALWVSDGSAAGTVAIAGPIQVSAITPSAGGAFFLSSSGGTTTLGRTDGTAGGTSVVTTFPGAATSLVANGALAAFRRGSDLWVTDGTAGGTQLAASSVSYDPVAAAGSFYFRSSEKTYRLDGTNVTPMPFLDRYPVLGMLGSLLLAGGYPAVALSDGTPAGTRTLEVAPGEPSFDSSCGTSTSALLGDTVIFTAIDNAGHCEPWASDGTAGGTRKLATAGRDAVLSPMVVMGGHAYFFLFTIGTIGTGAPELWRTDGTPAGTVLVRGFSDQGTDPGADGLIATDSALYFTLKPSFNEPYRLWKSDGTPAGTVPVAPSPPLGVYATMVGSVGSRAFYTTWSPTNDYGLWVTDGTPAGTVDLAVTTTPSSGFAVLGNRIAFSSYRDPVGSELWMSDGTLAGTHVLTTLGSGNDASYVNSILGVVGQRIVFVGSTPADGTALWSTDGTAAGTTRLPVQGGVLGSEQPGFLVGDKLYFRNWADALYVTDGTSAGTRLVAAGVPPLLGGTPGAIYSMSYSGLFVTSVTDGTTTRLSDVFDIDNTERVHILPNGAWLRATLGRTGSEPYLIPFDATAETLTFAPRLDVPRNATAISDPVRIVGINVAAPIASVGGQFCISADNTCTCDVAPYAASGNVLPGQYVCVRHTTANAPLTTVTTTVQVGSATAGFSSTTSAADLATLTLAAPHYEVMNNGTSALTIERQGSASGPVSVQWTTMNGTAIAGEDFGAAGAGTQLTGTLAWADGDTAPKTLQVGGAGSQIPLIAVPGIEDQGLFLVSLSNPAGNAVVGPISFVPVTIKASDALVDIAAYELQASEAGANTVVRITRTGAIDRQVSVSWQTVAGTATPGADFGTTGSNVPPQGVLVFEPGEFQKILEIGPNASPGPRIPILADGIPEPSETFTLQIAAASPGIVLGRSSVVVTILSGEPGVGMVQPVLSVIESISAPASAVIPVERFGNTGTAISVSYATSNGTALAGVNYTATSGTLTWDRFEYSTKYISVPLIDDTTPNTTRSFTVTLSNPIGATIAQATTRVDIEDDDSVVQFSAATASVVEGQNVVLTLNRTGPVTQSAQVIVQTYQGSAGSGVDFDPLIYLPVVWAAGDTSPKQVTIATFDDVLVEGDEFFSVAILTAYGTRVGPVGQVTVTIKDNDPGFAFSAPTYSAPEGTAAVTLMVKRLGTASQAASVHWSAANGSAIAGKDYGVAGSTVAPSGTLTWRAGEAASKTITIPILQDTITELTELFTVSLSSPSAGSGIGMGVATVYIQDDERPPESMIWIAATKVLVVENAGNAIVTVRRDPMYGGFTVPATVSYMTQPGSALAGSDYTARTGTLTWATLDGSEKMIMIPIINDAVAEPNESFKVVLSSPSSGSLLGTADVTVTIIDDDEKFPPAGAIAADWTVPASATKGWHVSSDAGAFEGVYSLRSDAIADNETAQLEVARNFAAGEVTFRVKVSSEANFDKLRFFVDGLEKGSWSGTAVPGWTLFTTPITAGSHTLRWSYEKDGSAAVGSDAAWIDAVTLP